MRASRRSLLPSLLLLLLLLLGACAKVPPAAVPGAVARAPASLPERLNSAVLCAESPATLGRIQSSELNEISGLIESRRQPGVFFVHNDSGDSPRFFAIDRHGAVLSELLLETVPTLIDAEDIANGPAPAGGSYLYLGDTGNNFASMGLGIPRRKAVLYRVAEPVIDPAKRQLELHEVWPIVLTFPDGARDVEAFFIDPLDGSLYMLGKQHDGHSQVLTASAAQLAGGGGELQLLGELFFGQGALPGSPMPTSASISRDGMAILVRSYSSAFLFRRQAGERVMHALLRAPLSLPVAREAQGEAIGFTDNDAAFLTISEGLLPAVHCTRLRP